MCGPSTRVNRWACRHGEVEWRKALLPDGRPSSQIVSCKFRETLPQRTWQGASKMAQQVNMPTTEPDALSYIAGPHGGRRRASPKYPLISTCCCTHDPLKCNFRKMVESNKGRHPAPTSGVHIHMHTHVCVCTDTEETIMPLAFPAH